MANTTFQAGSTEDAYINSANPTTNNDGNVELAIGEVGAGSLFRTWLKFALDDGTIPAGSTITLAQLTLTVSSDNSSNDRTLSVYRCERAVVEGEATWNIYSTGNSWTTAGASHADDREAANIGTATQPNAPSIGDTVVVTLTNAKIQEMIDGGAFTNNGFILQVDTENNDLIGYDSTDGVTAAERPKLYVEYTEPTFIPRTGGVI